MREERNVGGVAEYAKTELLGTAMTLFGNPTNGQITAVGVGPGSPAPGAGAGGTYSPSSYDSLVIATTGIVAYWPLGDPAGAIAAELVNGLDGAYSGGYTLSQPGAGTTSGLAVALNGSSGMITVPDNTLLNPVTQFSLEVWFQLADPSFSSGPDEFALLNKYDGTVQIGYAIADRSGGFIWFTDDDAAGGSSVQAATTPDSSWHYLVCTADQTWADIWLDGTRQAHVGSFLTSSSMDTPGKPLYIGHALAADDPLLDGVDTFFFGALQRVALYNDVISSVDIAAHYTAGLI